MDQDNSDPSDPAVLKRALKAFKKRIKMTHLGEETSGGRGVFSGGKVSGIVGITPPSQFPRAVWDELVRLNRLVESNGCYSIK